MQHRPEFNGRPALRSWRTRRRNAPVETSHAAASSRKPFQGCRPINWVAMTLPDKAPPPLRSGTAVGPSAVDELLRQAERFPGFVVHTHRRSDWIGLVDVAGQAVPDIGCAMWFSLSITSTGVVSYCCMDGTGAYPIG